MKKLLAAMIAVAMLAVPTQAMAQSPTNDSYDESSVQSVDPGDPADPVDPGNSSHTGEEGTGGSLPFTGTDVALLLAAGGGLLVLGFGARRLTRRPDTA